MEKNDDYVTIIRNGKECLVYDWSKNYTKNGRGKVLSAILLQMSGS